MARPLEFQVDLNTQAAAEDFKRLFDAFVAGSKKAGDSANELLGGTIRKDVTIRLETKGNGPRELQIATKDARTELDKYEQRFRRATSVQRGSLVSIRQQLREATQVRDQLSKFNQEIDRSNRTVVLNAKLAPGWIEADNRVKALQAELRNVGAAGGGAFTKISSIVDTQRLGEYGRGISDVVNAFQSLNIIVATLLAPIRATTGALAELQSFDLSFKAIGQGGTGSAIALAETSRIALGLGVNLLAVREAFKQLSPVVVNTGGDLTDVSSIVQSLSSRFVAFGLNADKSRRVLNGIVQAFAKGKLQAEELTQQISEADPAFKTDFAAALIRSKDALRLLGGEAAEAANQVARIQQSGKGPVQTLEELVKAGKITSKVLIQILPQLSKASLLFGKLGPTASTAVEALAQGNVIVSQVEANIANLNQLNLENLAKLAEPLVVTFLKAQAILTDFTTRILKLRIVRDSIAIFNNLGDSILRVVEFLLALTENILRIATPIVLLAKKLTEIPGIIELIGIAILGRLIKPLDRFSDSLRNATEQQKSFFERFRDQWRLVGTDVRNLDKDLEKVRTELERPFQISAVEAELAANPEELTERQRREQEKQARITARGEQQRARSQAYANTLLAEGEEAANRARVRNSRDTLEKIEAEYRRRYSVLTRLQRRQENVGQLTDEDQARLVSAEQRVRAIRLERREFLRLQNERESATGQELSAQQLKVRSILRGTEAQRAASEAAKNRITQEEIASNNELQNIRQLIAARQEELRLARNAIAATDDPTQPLRQRINATERLNALTKEQLVQEARRQGLTERSNANYIRNLARLTKSDLVDQLVSIDFRVPRSAELDAVRGLETNLGLLQAREQEILATIRQTAAAETDLIAVRQKAGPTTDDVNQGYTALDQNLNDVSEGYRRLTSRIENNARALRAARSRRDVIQQREEQGLASPAELREKSRLDRRISELSKAGKPLLDTRDALRQLAGEVNNTEAKFRTLADAVTDNASQLARAQARFDELNAPGISNRTQAELKEREQLRRQIERLKARGVELNSELAATGQVADTVGNSFRKVAKDVEITSGRFGKLGIIGKSIGGTFDVVKGKFDNFKTGLKAGLASIVAALGPLEIALIAVTILTKAYGDATAISNSISEESTRTTNRLRETLKSLGGATSDTEKKVTGLALVWKKFTFVVKDAIDAIAKLASKLFTFDVKPQANSVAQLGVNLLEFAAGAYIAARGGAFLATVLAGARFGLWGAGAGVVVAALIALSASGGDASVKLRELKEQLKAEKAAVLEQVPVIDALIKKTIELVRAKKAAQEADKKKGAGTATGPQATPDAGGDVSKIAQGYLDSATAVQAFTDKQDDLKKQQEGIVAEASKLGKNYGKVIPILARIRELVLEANAERDKGPNKDIDKLMRLQAETRGWAKALEKAGINAEEALNNKKLIPLIDGWRALQGQITELDPYLKSLKTSLETLRKEAGLIDPLTGYGKSINRLSKEIQDLEELAKDFDLTTDLGRANFDASIDKARQLKDVLDFVSKTKYQIFIDTQNVDASLKDAQIRINFKPGPFREAAQLTVQIRKDLAIAANQFQDKLQGIKVALAEGKISAKDAAKAQEFAAKDFLLKTKQSAGLLIDAARQYRENIFSASRSLNALILDKPGFFTASEIRANAKNIEDEYKKALINARTEGNQDFTPKLDFSSPEALLKSKLDFINTRKEAENLNTAIKDNTKALALLAAVLARVAGIEGNFFNSLPESIKKSLREVLNLKNQLGELGKAEFQPRVGRVVGTIVNNGEKTILYYDNLKKGVLSVSEAQFKVLQNQDKIDKSKFVPSDITEENNPFSQAAVDTKKMSDQFSNSTGLTNTIRTNLEGGAAAVRQMTGDLNNLPNVTISVAKTPSPRFAGGPVSSGSLYKVNELGQEGFLSNSGTLKAISKPRNGLWSPPSSGTVIPAHIWKQMKSSGSANVNLPNGNYSRRNGMESFIRAFGSYISAHSAITSSNSNENARVQAHQAMQITKLAKAVDDLAKKDWNVDVKVRNTGSMAYLDALTRSM